MAAPVGQDIEPLHVFVFMGDLVRLGFNHVYINLCYFLHIKWSWEIQGSSESPSWILLVFLMHLEENF